MSAGLSSMVDVLRDLTKETIRGIKVAAVDQFHEFSRQSMGAEIDHLTRPEIEEREN